MAAPVVGARRKQLAGRGRMWCETAVNTETHGNKQLTQLLPPGLLTQVAGANREIQRLLTTQLHRELLQGGAWPYSVSLEPGPHEAQ